MAVVVSPSSEITHKASLPAWIGVYWHLLSLDAPTVAALWAWSFSRAAHVNLPLLAPLLLAVGTWLVYVADRILDGLNRTRHEALQQRHYFYSQHRRVFLWAAAAVCPVFAWAVLTRMSPTARMEDTAVFAFAALYFILVHLRNPRTEQWLPKELAVGVLFAAATTVPTWSRASWSTRVSLVPLLAMFALLCWLNCVAIEVWERPSAAPKESIHRTTSWAGWNFHFLSKAAAFFALVLAVAFHRDTAQCCLYLASGFAALLLERLARFRHSLTTMQFRIAVDAALLTPFLFLAWMR